MLQYKKVKVYTEKGVLQMKTKINATELDYTNLGFAVDDCKEILKNIGIKMVDNCHYDFHTQRAFGIAKKYENKITINYYFFKACVKNNDMHHLYNTIIHEMLHIVVNQVDRRIGHTGLWKQLALKVSQKTPYNITRLASIEKMQLKAMEKPPKYVVTCDDCGKEYHYFRDCRAVQQIKSGNPFIKCPKCHGHLSVK
jgi:predicted SprT family Zn-dependent metalloprotease